jgi:MFS family permease
MRTPDQNRRAAWFALGVLFLINMLNFYDRQIGGAVNEPIAKEWNLSFADLGNLAMAFTLIYAAVGVPFGRLADRTSRKAILSAGVAVWSVLTAVSGLTSNYSSMFVTRLGVGIGEASCAPAANSLVGDLFPPRQRARALSIFMLGLPIGIFLSNAISGWLTGKEGYGWRSAFYVACIPGLLCAVAVLFIHEPARGSSEQSRSASGAVAGRAQRPGSPYLLVLGTPTILWIIVSGALHNFNMYATNSFLPQLIKLRHGVSPRDAGLIAGVVLGAVGVVGMLGGGWVADLLQRSRPNGRLLVASAAMFLSAPLIFLGLDQAPGSITAFMIFTGVGVMFLYVYYASVYAAIQDVIEPGLRGTAMALYFFAMYLVGGAFGPTVTGKLGDMFAARAMAAAGVSVTTSPVPDQFREIGLHQAFYVVPAICAALGVVLFAASRTVARDMRKLADWYEQVDQTPTTEGAVLPKEAVAGR